MNDPTPPPAAPPPRRLDRAPGERYRSADGLPPGSTGAGSASGLTAAQPRPDWDAGGRLKPSLGRAILLAIPAAAIFAAVSIWLAGPLSFTGGLVIAAIIAGRAIGLAVRVGGGRAVTSGRRVAVALAVTLLWFVVAQVGTWQFALNEGGDLPLLDYLNQVYGPLVFIELAAAGLAAWWSAR